MLRRNILTIFILLLLSIPGTLCAQKNTYTHPEDTVKDRLREAIEHADRSIDICIHDFVELDIYAYLEAARTRGVHVRVVILGSNLQGTLENTLIQKGWNNYETGTN